MLGSIGEKPSTGETARAYTVHDWSHVGEFVSCIVRVKVRVLGSVPAMPTEQNAFSLSFSAGCEATIRERFERTAARVRPWKHEPLGFDDWRAIVSEIEDFQEAHS